MRLFFDRFALLRLYMSWAMGLRIIYTDAADLPPLAAPDAATAPPPPAPQNSAALAAEDARDAAAIHGLEYPPAGSIVAIVDPVTSASMAGTNFRRRGASAVVRVQSLPDDKKPHFMSMVDSWPFVYAAPPVVIHPGPAGAANACAELRTRGVTLVAVGGQSGIPGAEALSSSLCPRFAHAPATAPARAGDKGDAYAALAAAGLRHGKYFVATEAAAAAAWAAHALFSSGGGAIVKRAASSGSDGAKACSTAAEVEAAVAAILGTKDMFGKTDSTALVMEKFSGPFLGVQTVSLGGVHLTTSVLLENQAYAPTGEPVYASRLVLDPQNHGLESTNNHGLAPGLVAAVVAYNDACLAALGVMCGPCHNELFCVSGPGVTCDINDSSEFGFALVDPNVRLVGSFLYELERAALGPDESQMDYTADVYCAGAARFKSRLIAQRAARRRGVGAYALQRCAARVYLLPPRTGWVAEMPSKRQLRARLPSLTSAFLAPRRRVTPRPSNFHGFVVLTGTSRDVERDARALRDWEKDVSPSGFYRYGPAPVAPLWRRLAATVGGAMPWAQRRAVADAEAANAEPAESALVYAPCCESTTWWW